jgi:Dolichyl-phosphate-mannose-protein mannosyltransferase
MAAWSSAVEGDTIMDNKHTRNPTYWLLPLLLVGAALLRLLHIDQPFEDVISWRQTDNATIADNFFRGHLNIFLPEVSWNGPGPNYVGYEFQMITYLAALLYHVFGQADWVARGISVCFGVWGVFAYYNLVRCAFDEVRALVGSAVLAVMPDAIFVDRAFISDPVMVSLVVTSFWMLLAYLQDRQNKYLVLWIVFGILGLATKISGLIVAIPALYAVLRFLPAKGRARLRYLIQLLVASILIFTPVAAYCVWAVHVFQAYPPHFLASKGNWVWDGSFSDWLESNYFIRKTFENAQLQWGIAILALFVIGLLLPSRNEKSNLKWLFHFWMFGGVIFYAIGAQELEINIWNFHIVDPAIAGLAGQGLVVLATGVTRLRLPLLARAAVIVFVVAIQGFEMSYLGWIYHPYARHSYEMGVAIGRISQPSDLVVTVANSTGDPVSIYYSRRRGWVWGYEADMTDVSSAIRSFDELRSRGAKWFGIVAEQRKKFREEIPQLLSYIESTSQLVAEDPDWVIYKMFPLLKHN